MKWMAGAAAVALLIASPAEARPIVLNCVGQGNMMFDGGSYNFNVIVKIDPGAQTWSIWSSSGGWGQNICVDTADGHRMACRFTNDTFALDDQSEADMVGHHHSSHVMTAINRKDGSYQKTYVDTGGVQAGYGTESGVCHSVPDPAGRPNAF